MHGNGLTRSTANSIKRLAFLLILIGLLIALDTFLKLDVIYRLWPILIAMVGGGLIGIFYHGNSQVPMFLVTGVYLLCFSGLALYCSFTSWTAMARLWPLFITFLGVVFLALCTIREKRRMVLLAGLLLISLSAMFSVTQSFGAGWWWIILILVGLSILVAEKVK
ncbi:MAG: hypothetical protein JW829_18050 [Pirellulales bacterium]|nr:hypothetical protein [Pirellulales bacterium]